MQILFLERISQLLVFCTVVQICATAISDTACDPGNTDATAGGAAVCQAVDSNAECPVGTTACACKSGYKQDTTNVKTCMKVITGTCATDVDCTGTVANSECSTLTCSCVAGYKEVNNLCIKAVSDTTCNPDTNGATVCNAVNQNAECPAGKSKCACKSGYKEGSPASNTCVLIPVSDTTCDPGDTDAATGGTAVCNAVDTNAECLAGTSKCACKSGYIQDTTNVNTCMKVITGTCSSNDDCTGTVTNSKCSSTTCSCVAGYKEVNNLCIKVITGSCSSDDDCTGTVANSKCSSTKCSCATGYKEVENLCSKVIGGTCNAVGYCNGTVSNSDCSEKKCSCKADYIEESHICKKALGKTCSNAKECVTNAECDTPCKCSSGFINSGGLCAAQSSATSAWVTTSVVRTSLLIYVLKLIY